MGFFMEKDQEIEIFSVLIYGKNQLVTMKEGMLLTGPVRI